MDQKLENKLKKAQINWVGARTRANESSGFTEVPDGRYLAHLTGAAIGESKSSGRLQIQWTWTIADGEFESDTKLDFDGLETEDNLVFLGRKLARFSYELPEDITAIADILDELVEKRPLARIRLKTKGEFQNVYVDKLMRSVDGDEDTDDSNSNDVGSDDDAESRMMKNQKTKNLMMKNPVMKNKKLKSECALLHLPKRAMLLEKSLKSLKTKEKSVSIWMKGVPSGFQSIN